MGKLLTDDKKHVDILTHVRVDKKLPKYVVMETNNGSGVKAKSLTNNTVFSVTPDSYERLRNNETLSYDNIKKILSEKNAFITDFNVTIGNTLNDVLDRTTMNGVWIGNNSIEVASDGNNERKKTGFWKRIIDRFSKQKPKKVHNDFDIIKFFADVHNLTSDEESMKYINRISDYIECIGYTEKTGQTALKEKLIKKLVINKLESVLYAKGMYCAINEDVIVKLAQNAPKPLSLDYIENYIRNIPIDVIKKKIFADGLQVFDNYCVLHYDENGESVEKTDREKEEEVEKRKDPILFGLINGSSKLYFIADWVDEKCDLTFDKMTEIVGKEIVESG